MKAKYIDVRNLLCYKYLCMMPMKIVYIIIDLGQIYMYAYEFVQRKLR